MGWLIFLSILYAFQVGIVIYNIFEMNFKKKLHVKLCLIPFSWIVIGIYLVGKEVVEEYKDLD
jgi:hypothetical protein